jgi:glycosyltransferase involved in cell wall biosynthesis
MARVAVLIPVYNNPLGLEKTLCSLVGAPVDVVVVDDGSSPPLVLPRVGAGCTILIRLESNLGIERALNAGLEHIRAQQYAFVARLDAGDTTTADRFLKQRAYLEAHPSCVLVGSHVAYTALDGTPLYVQYLPTDSAQIRRKMHLKNCFSHPAILLRTAALEQVGTYSLDYPAAEDYDFFFRCVRHYDTANLDEILTSVEANPDGISIRNHRQQIRSCLKVQWHNFAPRRIESYLGVMRTFAHFILPRRCLLPLKRLLHRPTETQR